MLLAYVLYAPACMRIDRDRHMYTDRHIYTFILRHFVPAHCAFGSLDCVFLWSLRIEAHFV